MMYVILAIIIISLCLNYWVLKKGLKDVNYTVEIENPVCEINEDIMVKSIVENYRKVTVPFIQVKEVFNDATPSYIHRFSLLLKAHERVIRRHSFKINKRGVYKSIKVDINLGDFLGFTGKEHNFSYNKEIIVKPKKVKLMDNITPTTSKTGSISVRRFIYDDPLMVVGVREYTSRDAQKLIHWPSSVRYGKLMVKKFDYTSDVSAYILLNNETSRPSPIKVKSNLIEDSIITCRSLVEDFHKNNIDFGFSTNNYNRISKYERGYTIASGCGNAHKERVLELLGRVDYKSDLRFHKMVDKLKTSNINTTSVIIVTPLILDEYIESFNDLCRKVPKVIVITHSDENIKKLNTNIEVYRGGNHA